MSSLKYNYAACESIWNDKNYDVSSLQDQR